ncbi:MAG: hypothetical protein KGZ97_09800 [Bacteroidetes bacterium]|nr:hypothetical protein [Bacteroidota bacterium]
MKNIAGEAVLNFWHVENGRSLVVPDGGFATLKDDFEMISYNYIDLCPMADLKNRMGNTIKPISIFETMRVVPIAYREFWESQDGDTWGFDEKSKGTLKSEFIFGLVAKDNVSKKEDVVIFGQLTLKGYSAGQFTKRIIRRVLLACDQQGITPRDTIINFGIDKSQKFDNGDGEKKGVTLISLTRVETHKLESKDRINNFFKNLVANGWYGKYIQRDMRQAK